MQLKKKTNTERGKLNKKACSFSLPYVQKKDHPTLCFPPQLANKKVSSKSIELTTALELTSLGTLNAVVFVKIECEISAINKLLAVILGFATYVQQFAPLAS